MFTGRAFQSAADVQVLRAARVFAVAPQPTRVHEARVRLALDDADDLVRINLGEGAEGVRPEHRGRLIEFGRVRDLFQTREELAEVRGLGQALIDGCHD